MKKLMIKEIGIYTTILCITLLIAGIILLPHVTNIFVLLAVLFIVFIVFFVLLVYVSEKYVRPLTKMSKTINNLLKGNYYARINHGSGGIVGDLSEKINQLARNLSELTIQEKIQAEQLSTVIENSPTGLVLI